ncbi:MAG: exonuclease SbcCD subunit D C-terminal domain-containing protein [Candidatus Sedimenticola endophacoides]
MCMWWVVGAACEDPADEVLVLHDAAGAPELIVCAVPYLRERDIRQVTPGESVRYKERKLLEGVRGHDAALRRREALAAEVPIVGMGHLFTADGESVEGDGVRDLYVGSLAHVSPGIFPACFDYLALGHLHLPQTVNARYSGSPLAMGFGEACQSKSLCLVELDAAGARVQLIGVPVFRRLERVRGDWEAVSARIGELAGGGFDGWVEVVYEGGEVVGGLRRRLDEITEGRPLEILRVRNTRLTEQVLSPLHESETLGDLNVDEVFRRCLDLHEVPEPQRPELTRAYRETLAALAEEGWDGSAGGEGR